MKILVTGAKGLLGHKLSLEASKFGQVFGLDHKDFKLPGVKTIVGDILEPPKLSIDIVLHTAALADVDLCEKNPALAYKINVLGTKRLLGSYPKSKFVYISTDGVFDGKKGKYSEEDEPAPINIYGKTKLAGEKLVPKNGIIVRTSFHGWNIAPGKTSLSENIIKDLNSGRKVSASKSSIFSPLLNTNLASALIELVFTDFVGLINLSSPDAVSKFNFAEIVAEAFNLDNRLIGPKNQDNIEAIRPKNISLDSSKARYALKTKLLAVKEGLNLMKEELKNIEYTSKQKEHRLEIG